MPVVGQPLAGLFRLVTPDVDGATRPPRAAISHSASVGSASPAHVAYASASSYATCTTGWSARLSIDECGPAGCRQDAPGVQVHHRLRCRRSTGPGGAGEHHRTRLQVLGRGAGVVRRGSAAAPRRSRSRWRRRRWRIRRWSPGGRRIQNPSTPTSRTGASSG